MPQLIDIFLNAFITLTVIVDPIGTAAVFCGLTASYPDDRFRKTAFRAATIAFCVLLFFGFFGSGFIKQLGITLPAFRIAGGLLLFVSAFRMLFGQPSPDSVDTDRTDVYKDHDVAVFPVAIPLMAGPGCITATILLMTRAQNTMDHIAVLGALIATIGTALACLLAAKPIQKILGNGGVNILARIMGVVLAALAVQFTADGLKGMLSQV